MVMSTIRPSGNSSDLPNTKYNDAVRSELINVFQVSVLWFWLDPSLARTRSSIHGISTVAASATPQMLSRVWSQTRLDTALLLTQPTWKCINKNCMR
jgi:hypothetical protein